MKLDISLLTLVSCGSLLALGALAACGDSSGTTGSGGATTSSSSSGKTTSSTSSSTGTGSTGTGSTGTGSTTTSTGTGGMAQAECTTAADCKLLDDCCSCEGIPKTMTPPMCGQVCAQSSCMALGYTGSVDCIAGHCAAAFDCDAAKVACATPTPICQPGFVPEVKGLCWTNHCVPAKECAFVDDCAACTATQACVFYGGGIMHHYCVDVPPECNGTASCACMGQSICGNIPCGGTGNQLFCAIP